MFRKFVTVLCAVFVLSPMISSNASADEGLDTNSPISDTTEVVAKVKAAAIEVNVYTQEGEREVNGRKWRTTCEPYSQMKRCRAEIWATQINQVSGKFVKQNGWVFNNLTYLPSSRTIWNGNILASGGEYNVDGRLWRTSCGDDWTGIKGCRSFIWATVTSDSTGRLVSKNQWIFNNIVNFNETVGVSRNPDLESAPGKAVYTVYNNGVAGSPENSGTRPPGNPLNTINANPNDKHLPYTSARADQLGIKESLRFKKKDGSTVTVTREAQYNVKLAINAIKKTNWGGVSEKDKEHLAVLAVLTMAQESTFGTNKRAMMPDNNNDVGVYQQRSLVGWYADGNTQAENVKILTESIPYGTLTFIEGHIVKKQGPSPAGRIGYRIPGVFSKKNWLTREPWDVVTDVQRPAKSTYHHYENWQPVAKALVALYK